MAGLRTLSLPRRIQRIWGVAALVGMGLFVLGLIAGLIAEIFGHEGPPQWWVIAPLLGGLVIIAPCWPVWAVWSKTLDNAKADPDGRQSTTTKITLWAIGLTGVGFLLFLPGVVPFLVAEEGPDWLAVALSISAGLGAALIVIALAGSAIAGAVALGGAKWWWVGVVFDIGFAVAVYGVYVGDTSWAIVGGLVLAASVGGYSLALAAGVKAKRRAALEAQRIKQYGDFTR